MQPGTVYLLHFTRPYKHARHYLGFTTNLEERLRHHRQGRAGSHLMRVVKDAGIGFEVAITWEGSRALERRLKNNGNIKHYCPICSGEKAWKLTVRPSETTREEAYDEVDQADYEAFDDIPF